jgi:hypothetical protein
VFLGHFGVALAAKKVDASVSLATCVAAAQLCDLIWPVLVLAGVEKVTIVPGETALNRLRFDSYPISHSLATVTLWAAAYAGLHFARKRRAGAAVLLAGLVLSHWVLDVVSHRPDVPIAPGSDVRLGLGLWNSLPATLAAEALLFGGGIAVYLSSTRARDAVGRWGLLSLLATLAVAYAASVVGPPPPSVQALAWTAVGGGSVFAAWAAWADRHREGS